ncbi:hypothetical protein I204_01722 [Kwoniella mangroviensis CBS 8886]|uniref:uncharacterized protein n=1 Tax=Kwoniella mangroviensis CBS 8507 TaxID=1296122 RepID=UPI00080D0B71|nr:uncharacterized protein I203_03973 [Kwoniella mangroviensis CBS 8507]OCF67285.1 hypothetical protein I203_03973 [Kwoniella mangroviensis CBS 8507]OCF77722.1 hypothetical protein I204_01722 [Kwoniella mangroviensis CBS 8886]
MSHSHDNSVGERYLKLLQRSESGETNAANDQAPASQLQDLRRSMQYARSTERMDYAPPSESSSSTRIVISTDQTTTSTGWTTNTTGQPTATHDSDPFGALQRYLDRQEEARDHLTEMGLPERVDQDGCMIAAGFVSGIIGSDTARARR